MLQGLEAITQTWEITEFDITPYKDKGHYKLRSATAGGFPSLVSLFVLFVSFVGFLLLLFFVVIVVAV